MVAAEHQRRERQRKKQEREEAEKVPDAPPTVAGPLFDRQGGRAGSWCNGSRC